MYIMKEKYHELTMFHFIRRSKFLIHIKKIIKIYVLSLINILFYFIMLIGELKNII